MDVTCPTCHARPGIRCIVRDETRKPMETPHRARVRKVNATLHKAPQEAEARS